jgi:peptide/nickel transport system permease protein
MILSSCSMRRWSHPTAVYWLGTDELGRDFFSRLLLGGQISIVAAALARP